MQMVTCPNGGRCGHSKHRLGTKAYQQCFEQSTSGGSQAKSHMPAPTSTYERQNQSLDEYRLLIKTMQERKAYSAAESFVNKDMVIQEDMVQTYINNPDEINELCREEWDCYILDDIKKHSEEIFDKLGMDIDECDSEEIEYVLDAALEADRSDIAGAMAKNMGPRTFSTPVSLPRKKMALREANEQFDFGTDGWFESVADRYWRDMTGKDGRLDDPSRRSLDGWSSTKHKIEQAIRETVTRRGVVVESADDLPDFSVVWTSTLDDISPAINKERSVEVGYPFLVASYSDTGAVGDPVKLNAGYRIGYEEIPSFIGDPRISMSQIVDERTSDNAILNLSGKDAMAEYIATLSTL